ncbi:hypothetical protein D3C80_2009500 [compost metagenome]
MNGMVSSEPGIFGQCSFNAKLGNSSLQLYRFGIIGCLEQQCTGHGTSQRLVAQAAVISLQGRRYQTVIR